MRGRIVSGLCTLALLIGLVGCVDGGRPPRIGVSFGVGGAARWAIEAEHMKDRAVALGAEIDVRLNRAEGEPTTQEEDCRALIDSGIDVLILIPRSADGVAEILNYAREKKVKVISYARVVLGETVDLLVGYDSARIGQLLAAYLTELVYEGDYILLYGDPKDNNATLLRDGTMRYITPIENEINIILNVAVPGWSADEAKRLVKEAVAANGNHVDAILALNDAIAGACVEALDELGVTDPVAITGMDAELPALQRIAAGKQSATIYLDLKELAYTAVEQAWQLAKGEPVEINAEYDNGSETLIDAKLVTGKLITRDNLDKALIETGLFTREEIYNP